MPLIEFRCSICDGREYIVKKTVITCTKCNMQRTTKEHWKHFVVVRRCVSKLDYDYYKELEEKNND